MAAAIAGGRPAATDADDDSFDDLASLGGTVGEAIAAFKERQAAVPPEEAIEVWEENEMVIRWFLAVMTQWRRAANGLPTGLDYSGCREVAQMLFQLTAIPAEMFAGLQVMELAYVQRRVELYSAQQPGRIDR